MLNAALKGCQNTFCSATKRSCMNDLGLCGLRRSCEVGVLKHIHFQNSSAGSTGAMRKDELPSCCTDNSCIFRDFACSVFYIPEPC
jgi:hypothetical protein